MCDSVYVISINEVDNDYNVSYVCENVEYAIRRFRDECIKLIISSIKDKDVEEITVFLEDFLKDDSSFKNNSIEHVILDMNKDEDSHEEEYKIIYYKNLDSAKKKLNNMLKEDVLFFNVYPLIYETDMWFEVLLEKIHLNKEK